MNKVVIDDDGGDYDKMGEITDRDRAQHLQFD